ncbi:MAG: leucine--tRNA ligase [Candidatus Micrarchaeota archaeon]
MVDFTSIENKWQSKWYTEKIFEPKTEKNKEKFLFTVPYPYVSGALHVGHGRTYVNGDIAARFKRMLGYNVMWPIAFHITGTPVLAVSSKIAAGDEATIKLYNEYVSIYEEDKSKVPAIVKSFTEPWKLVNYFSSKMIQDFKSIGFSLDLSRQFTTGDKEYNAFVTWQFHKYKDAGYLKQASYPILYCVNCKNAVGEDDIQDADTEPVEVQKFTAPKFKLKGEKAFLVTATLRPDTIYGVTNLFVKPGVTYVRGKVEINGNPEEWILSPQAAEKLAFQQIKFTKIAEINGDSLIGKEVETPTGSIVPIVPGEFIEEETGTGIVHSEPSDAPFDLVAIEELKRDEKTLAQYPGLKEKVNAIKFKQVISCSGYSECPALDLVKKYNVKTTKQADVLNKITKQLYKDEFYGGKVVNSGEFNGLPVEQAKEKMAAWLEKTEKAHHIYETSRLAKCRCGGKVVTAVMNDQWFLDFNAKGWKEKSHACLAQMKIYPENYRKQFEDTFAWLDKRPCARRRGLGTQLPFANEWIIESLSDSTIYPALYTVIKEIRVKKLKPEQLTVEFFDYVFLGKGKPEDVAKKIKCKAKDLEDIRAEFVYWYPCDQRHTAIAHITNHLSFYVFAHAAIFDKKFWPKAITVNELLISEGTKMSKSKGNVITLDAIRKNYSADLYRLYSVATADFASVLDFRKADIENSRKSLTRLYGVLENLIELSKKKTSAKSGKKKESNLTAWILSKFESRLEKSTAAIEGLELRLYAQSAIYGILNDWEYFAKRASEEEKITTAKHIVKKWILLLTPLIPHSCEELNEQLGEKTYASLSQWPNVEKKLINPNVEQREEYVKNIFEDVTKIKDVIQRKNNKLKLTKCTLIVASDAKWAELFAALKKDSLEKVKTTSEAMQKHMEKHFYSLQEQHVKQIDEMEVINQAKTFLEKELTLTIDVESEEKSSHEKAIRAVPLKPSIVLE